MRPQPTGHPVYRWAVSGTFWSAIFTFSPFIVSGVGIWLLLYCLVAHPFASLARLITGKKRKVNSPIPPSRCIVGLIHHFQRRSRWHPAIVLNRIVFPSEEDLPSQSQTTPATETERGAAVPNYDTESQPSMSSVPDSPPQAHHAAVEPPLSPIPEQLEQAPRQPRDGSGQGDQVLAGHHPSTQPGPTLSQFDGETRDDDNRDRSVRFSGEDTVHTYPSGRSSTRLQDVSSQ